MNFFEWKKGLHQNPSEQSTNASLAKSPRAAGSFLGLAGKSVIWSTLFLLAGFSLAKAALSIVEFVTPPKHEPIKQETTLGPVVKPSQESKTVPGDNSAAAPGASSATAVPEQVKAAITKEPPRVKSSKVSAEPSKTVTNDDGSKTVAIAEGDAAEVTLGSVSSSANSDATAYSIKFTDKTGAHADLEKPIKDYLNGTLKWSNEISYLKEITVEDAGDTGWSGQYGGTYSELTNGDITSAYGVITLNVYYYQSSPYFTDYMKLVFSHEYGHHYSLYHKWVDGDLPIGTRFPDSYYSTRPLSKDAVTVDCSTWNTCESEVVAEDYSYIYSGYAYHAMQSTLGLPSLPAMQEWFNNITTNIKSTAPVAASPAPVANTPPVLTIVSPASEGDVTYDFTFAVTATDDKRVSKVEFWRNNELLSTNTAAPYEVGISLRGLAAGDYTFRASAVDNEGAEASKQFTVTIVASSSNVDTTAGSGTTANDTNAVSDTAIANTTDALAPVVTFTRPPTNPYTWRKSALLLQLISTDNVAVTKTELYINDELVATEPTSTMTYSWSSEGVPAGTYQLKAKAYDAAGNIGESTITINR